MAWEDFGEFLIRTCASICLAKESLDLVKNLKVFIRALVSEAEQEVLVQVVLQLREL